MCITFVLPGFGLVGQERRTLVTSDRCRTRLPWVCSGRRSENKPFVVHDDCDEADVFLEPVSISQDLGPDRPFLESCATCDNTGFVPCSTCIGQGVVQNKRSVNVFYCPDCVGHKKVRCPACGGKCYMCQ